PLVDYAAIEHWIEAQRGGSAAAITPITPGIARCYEPTSGSSGAIKHIPYNDALLGAFRGLFAIWAHDLLTHSLRLRSGRTFMSVSPPLDSGEGFADDGEYLGRPLRALIGRFIVTPPKLRDPEAFRDALATSLLAAEDLEIVSVWNPTYLLVLLDHIEANRERLSAALPPNRRALLRRDPLPWATIWPSLQLLSCWSAAAAAGPARALARHLPQARLQGKGLLATEAPVTVPLIQANGCVPLVDSVFLELEDDEGRLHLLSEVEPDAECEYALIVTQPGGLLRYRLGDRVRVSGRHRSAPLLDFVGRADRVSDLVGEKLAEAFVADALAGIIRSEAFATLHPLLPENRPPRYCLLTDDPDPRIAGLLETALMQAFRYREARLLGQLAAVEVLACADMRRTVHDALIASGMKAGDIKDQALVVSVDLARGVHAAALQRVWAENSGTRAR
ncbi:GH3 auxin-responsive promoter family protein, partial [Accumulibacter sp.]|uniref:GH3 family domain-containing protein n=1 Tax=Accumulibacter sp. TaxID=2053492 RepID=UPI0028C3DE79